jgi:hypothetical protein
MQTIRSGWIRQIPDWRTVRDFRASTGSYGLESPAYENTHRRRSYPRHSRFRRMRKHEFIVFLATLIGPKFLGQ